MKKAKNFITRWPMVSFIVLLAIVLGLIALSNKIQAPKAQEESTDATASAKVVQTHKTGAITEITTAGHVEQSGVVTVTATTAGIVTKLYVKPGQAVGQRRQIATLADTYSGGNSAAVAAQIAAENAAVTAVTTEKNLSILDDQRDAVRGDSDDDEIARKQFTVQKRNAEAALRSAELQKAQAQVAAASYYPRTPIAGTVEEVFVSVGDRVNPGDKIAVISSKESYTKVTATVSAEVAQTIAMSRPSQIMTKAGQIITATPQYVSQVPTAGQTFTVVYMIAAAPGVIDNDYLDVTIPLESAAGNNVLVPLDAVQLTNDGAIVFIAQDGIAKATTVELGAVIGQNVYVTKGVKLGDEIVVNRNVFDGDNITTMQEMSN